VEQKPTSKWRLLPMNTIDLQKRASRLLRITSERTMHVAEALYQRGILSYPRTETDFFKVRLDPALLPSSPVLSHYRSFNHLPDSYTLIRIQLSSYLCSVNRSPRACKCILLSSFLASHQPFPRLLCIHTHTTTTS
jgi:hypothetical protein